MRFTLFNLIAVNLLVALLFGLLFCDETKIKANADELRNDMRFIVESRKWQSVPLEKAKLQELNHGLLFYSR